MHTDEQNTPDAWVDLPAADLAEQHVGRRVLVLTATGARGTLKQVRHQGATTVLTIVGEHDAPRGTAYRAVGPRPLIRVYAE